MMGLQTWYQTIGLNLHGHLLNDHALVPKNDVKQYFTTTTTMGMLEFREQHHPIRHSVGVRRSGGGEHFMCYCIVYPHIII